MAVSPETKHRLESEDEPRRVRVKIEGAKAEHEAEHEAENETENEAVKEASPEETAKEAVKETVPETVPEAVKETVLETESGKENVVREQETETVKQETRHQVESAESKPTDKKDAKAIAAAALAKINAKLKSKVPVRSPVAFAFDTQSDALAKRVVHLVEINDHRNKYLLTNKENQRAIAQETGVKLKTKGRYYPDKTMSTTAVPPLSIEIDAPNQDALEKALDRLDALLRRDLGPLVDERRLLDGPRSDPSSNVTSSNAVALGSGWSTGSVIKVPLNISSSRPAHQLRPLVMGQDNQNVMHIETETGTRLEIMGHGSGNLRRGVEENVPMYFAVSGGTPECRKRAKELIEDLVQAISESESIPTPPGLVPPQGLVPPRVLVPPPPGTIPPTQGLAPSPPGTIPPTQGLVPPPPMTRPPPPRRPVPPPPPSY